MEDTEIRLRLIEAASALPAIRVLTDLDDAANRAKAVAKVWYDEVVGDAAPRRKQHQRR